VLRCGSARPSDGGFNPALAWSNDGRWLVTTSWDGSLCAFRGDDGAPAAPALQQVPASRVFDWHLAQAELAGERRRPSVARFHLARVRNQEPPDPLARIRRARLLTRCGDWENAVADFQRAAMDCETDDESTWLDHGRALLFRGERESYRRLSQHALTHIRKFAYPRAGNINGRFGAETVELCALGPAATADLADALALAEELTAQRQQSDLLLLGLLHYRAGHRAEARKLLQEAADKDAANAWRTWPALALAHHSLGEDSEARRFLARAEEKRRDLQRRLADESPEFSLEAEWPDFELLYAEAAAALTPR
jgi:tetratricopeptide (TPR) repeat protein